MTSVKMPTGMTSTLDNVASDTYDHAKAWILGLAVLPPDQQDDVASGTRHHIPHPGAPLVGRVNPFAGCGIDSCGGVSDLFFKPVCAPVTKVEGSLHFGSACDAPGIGGLFGPPLV